MKTKSVSLRVSAAIGSVSGEYIIPTKSSCVMTIAHGAGAGMHHPFMTTLAQSLAENGITTLRFNFPFTENKKGRPDVPAIAHAAIEAAIRHARKQYPSLPLFISGKSFGGRMSSQYLSTHHDTEVSGIIFYGFPLHAPGKPSIERAAHLKDVKEPMLFLSGTRDEFASLKLLEKVCSALPGATLLKIEGANHAFKAGKVNTMEILVRSTKDWIEKIS
jgi:predicted alpha/beta-hydrolase family hydrolase